VSEFQAQLIKQVTEEILGAFHLTKPFKNFGTGENGEQISRDCGKSQNCSVPKVGND